MQNKILTLFQPHDHDTAFEKLTKELLVFGGKQALSCLFPAFIFLMLFVSKAIHVPFLHRYDFLLIACISMQAIMYFSKLETKDELLVICMFHLIGLCMEIFKVHMGSWSYPEPGLSKVFGVPLYSGFMYASVASYICQAWRHFDLRISGFPKDFLAIGMVLLIYLNFFTHHFIPDFRWLIILLLIIVFYRTKVQFNTNGIFRQMPLVVAFMLIAFFVWIAENIATFFGAWQYAYQHAGWKMVLGGKMVSWFLMIVISIIIVIELKRIKERLEVKAKRAKEVRTYNPAESK